MPAWTTSEIKLVKRLYPQAPRAEIQEAIPRHTWECIRAVAYRSGAVRSHRKVVPASWTIREIEMVKRLYPLAPQSEIEDAIPRHKWPSIQRAASRLGLSRQTRGNLKWLRIAHEYLGDAR